jgi:Zn finger protein HypA/HybF involved in hydrogenase expression
MKNKLGNRVKIINVKKMIYCLKCGKHTTDVGVKHRVAKNGRRMLCANCAKCKSKKCQFIANNANILEATSRAEHRYRYRAK